MYIKVCHYIGWYLQEAMYTIKLAGPRAVIWPFQINGLTLGTLVPCQLVMLEVTDLYLIV